MRRLSLFFSIFDEFQVPPLGLEYELKLGNLRSIHLDANILETMPRKKFVLVCVDMA